MTLHYTEIHLYSETNFIIWINIFRSQLLLYDSDMMSDSTHLYNLVIEKIIWCILEMYGSIVQGLDLSLIMFFS